jgi:hypothetical protein
MLNINTANFNVEDLTRRDEKSRHETFSQMALRAVFPFEYSEPLYFLALFIMFLVNGIADKRPLKRPWLSVEALTVETKSVADP